MKIILIIILLLQLFSCDNKLEILKGDDFTVTLLPYHSQISEDETCNFYITISSPSSYKYTSYSLRYFQTSGKGELVMDDGRTLEENQIYILPRKVFTLSYTSHSSNNHSITLYFSDSNSNTHTITITLQSPY